ncbi:MAG: hypothetical protein ACTSQP_15335 [Promethearchaeota archaeon]
MSIRLFEIEGRKIIPTDNTPLNDDKIYIIIDEHAKRPKIWIWSGKNSKMMDRYFAGVSATKIKSKEKLYGASIEVVESGNEPERFPLLSKDKIAQPISEAEPYIVEEIIEEKQIVPPKEEIPKVEAIETKTEKETEVKPSPLELKESIEKEYTLFKEKVISLLREIDENFNNIHKKIKSFLKDI